MVKTGYPSKKFGFPPLFRRLPTVSGRFIQKLMHTFHSLFHRLGSSKQTGNFSVYPQFPRFPHFSACDTIHPCIFMQFISFIRNKIQKMQERFRTPAFFVTGSRPGWIWSRRRSAPYRRCFRPGIHSTPGSRSWPRCRRRGSGAAGTPPPPTFRQPGYPVG